MAEQAQAQHAASVWRTPLTVASLLIGLSLLAALLAGLEINRPPIGAVDSRATVSIPASVTSPEMALPVLSFTPISKYLSAASPVSAENFQPVPTAKNATPPSRLFCAETRMMVGGWAADPRDGAPVARVELYVDRQHAGDARVGIARPDVEEYFHRVDFAKSGWQLELPLRTLSTGFHYMEIWAVDRDGASRLLLEHHFQYLSSRPC